MLVLIFILCLFVCFTAFLLGMPSVLIVTLFNVGHISTGYWKCVLLCLVIMMICGIIIFEIVKRARKRNKVIDRYTIEKIKKITEKNGDFLHDVYVFSYLEGEKKKEGKVECRDVKIRYANVEKPIMIKQTSNKVNFIEYLLTFGWFEDYNYVLFVAED